MRLKFGGAALVSRRLLRRARIMDSLELSEQANARQLDYTNFANRLRKKLRRSSATAS